MIIGLTGPYCSGKDTVAEYLVRKKGFIHRSLSDELRKELVRRGIPTTREDLIAVGTELRQTQGNDVLARRVIEDCGGDRDYVITSIRHPSEVEHLSRRGDFYLVNVDAPAKVRFRRMKHRDRPGDPETFEKFVELENKESQTAGSGQQLTKVASLASVTFVNDAVTAEELQAKIDRLLEDLRSRNK
jgi:dephospho-CoA kinase